MVRVLFLMVCVLTPCAAAESFLDRAFLIEALPSGPEIVHADVRFGLRRAQTVFSHPILFGVFVAATLGLTWYVLPPATRLLRAGVAWAGTFFSLSTGALVAYVAQAGLIAWEMITKPHPKRWTVLFVAAAICYVAIDLLSNRTPFHLLVQHLTLNPNTAYGRILIFEHGMRNVWANPLLGIGQNEWARASWMGSSIDNFWLLVAMQGGIPAFAMMLAAFATLMRAVAAARLKDPLALACRAGWLTALGGLIIAGGTVHFWTTMLCFLMLLLGAGAWLADADAELATEPSARDRRGGRDRRAARSDVADTTPGAGATRRRSPGDEAGRTVARPMRPVPPRPRRRPTNADAAGRGTEPPDAPEDP